LTNRCDANLQPFFIIISVSRWDEFYGTRITAVISPAKIAFPSAGDGPKEIKDST
jgi:hypothetical protein